MFVRFAAICCRQAVSTNFRLARPKFEEHEYLLFAL